METLFIYFGKVILASGVMFLYYQLFLKDKTFHHYNRFYLLAMVLVSLLLPLLKVSYFTLEVNNDIYLLISKLNNNNLKSNENAFSYFQLFAVAFGLVSIFLLARFLFGVYKISLFKKSFPKENFEGINFYQTDLNNAPFSYFRNLFWKNSILIQSDLGKQILKHEMVHIEQKHTLDKIFIETVKSLFWFNPFFYLIQKEIHLIHEYLADKKALKHSDTKAFAQMLLASRFSGKMIPATSPFLSSNLKKRLKMLQKPKTKFSYARRILALPLFFALAFAYLVNAKNKEIKATNLEIQKAAKELLSETSNVQNNTVQDTLKANSKVNELLSSSALEKANKEIANLGKSIEEKSKELKTLKPESEDFEKKIQEINALSNRINGITSSEEYQNNIDQLSKSPMIIHLNNEDGSKDGKDLKIFFTSPEQMKQLKLAENFTNSKEWQQYFKDLEKMKFELPEMPELPPMPPLEKIEFGKDGTWLYKNHPEIFIDKAEKSAKIAELKAKGSEKLAKERKKLAEKQKELSKKQKELARKQAELAEKEFSKRYSVKDSPNIVVMKKPMAVKSMDNVIYINSNDLANSKIPGEIKYFIDGKSSTEAEMKALDPKNIASINVNKNDNSAGEIRIKTKK